MRVFGVELSFVGEHAERLRSLSGWMSSFRIPHKVDGAAQTFVAGLAQAELNQDLDRVFAKLKQAFRFTRREMVVSEPEAGTRTIATPHFAYSVNVSLSPTAASEVIWSRTVDSIKNAQQISSPAFAEVFDGVFDTLEFSLPKRQSIEDLIDAVEAAKIPDITLQYDRDATFCELHIQATAGTVILRPNRMSIVHPMPRKTQQLIESFDAVYLLATKYNLPLLSFLNAAKQSPPTSA